MIAIKCNRPDRPFRWTGTRSLGVLRGLGCVSLVSNIVSGP